MLAALRFASIWGMHREMSMKLRLGVMLMGVALTIGLTPAQTLRDGVAGGDSTQPADANAAASGPSEPERPTFNRGQRRRPLAGPTSAEGFRDPFGMGGVNIFSPLEWPDPNRNRLATGAPGPDYWQQQVDYRIDAALDVETRTIRAWATITYHNNSPDELTYLWLHLEQNLFRPDSIGALSTEPESRFGFREGMHGGFDIHSIQANGHPLQLHVYDTMGRIDLDSPIRPGQTFTFSIDWSFSIPQYGADRMGIEQVEQGTIFELAQWFPAVACYDDVDGWNTMGYLGQGEFYTDFGDFDVSITVPRSHIVVASGQLQNPGDVLTLEQQRRLAQALESDQTVGIRTAEEVGDPASRPAGQGPLTWHFKSQGMRTFAWASSDAFIYDAAGLDVPGSRFAPGGRVLVQAVYPKEGMETWAGAVQMARHSIGFNSKMWYPFPYPVATNVNGIVGGMEYPGFVMCSSRRSERGLYGVTDHEFGHTWFPMMVNSNERRYAWMDEGFNSFLNIYTSNDYQNPGTEPSRQTAARGRGLPRGNQQPIMTYPDRMWRGQLGNIAYGKPAKGLFLLREFVLGHERFDRAFKEYIRRWAFRHPQPADFFRTMEDVAGVDLAWFWRGWFYTNSTLDQAIADVEQVEDANPREEGDQPWVYVELTNNADMVMPVRMEVSYDDGTSEVRDLPVEIWFSTNAWTVGFDPLGRRVVKVVLDPEHMLPDTERANNIWPEPESEPEDAPGRSRGSSQTPDGD